MSSVIPFDRTPLPKTPRGQFYFLALYDTPDDKLRVKLAQRCLEGGLSRVQLSCYVGCVTEVRARALWESLMALAKADEPDPLARVTVMRLDQGQLWPSVHIPSPRAELTPISWALQPPRVGRYLVYGDEDAVEQTPF